jgi:hypothetical protein
MIDQFLSHHPTRWVYVRKVSCALASLYGVRMSDETIRYILNSLYPNVLEKKRVGKRNKYRFNIYNR